MNTHAISQRMRANAILEREIPASAVFVQPPQHNWARYKSLERAWRTRTAVIGPLSALAAVAVLAWRAVHGMPVSEVRWFCAVGLGLLLPSLARLALFTLLAAPRKITLHAHTLHLSGLGHVRPDQVMRWSLRGNVIPPGGGPNCTRLHITYLRLGLEREWSMLLDDGDETARLLRLLQERLPQTGGGWTGRIRGVIGIEARALSR